VTEPPYEQVPELENSPIGLPALPICALLFTDRFPSRWTAGLLICELFSRQRFPRTYSATSMVTLFPSVMHPDGWSMKR